jgi:hypothetical protein
MDGGEEVIEYMVGPRGKIEVGEKGVAGLVREVYGRPDPDMLNGNNGNTKNAEDKEEMEEFESRLQRSLGLGKRQKPEANGDYQPAETPGRSQATRRTRRRAAEEEPEDDDEDSDD